MLAAILVPKSKLTLELYLRHKKTPLIQRRFFLTNSNNLYNENKIIILLLLYNSKIVIKLYTPS